MSQLNANASEWRPSGNATSVAANALTDLALPPSMVHQDGGYVAAPPGLSTAAREFTPGAGVGASAGVSAATPYYPTFSTGAAADATDGVLGAIDWQAEFTKVMELTEKMIAQQLHPPSQPEAGSAAKAGSATASATGPAAGTGAGESVSAGVTPALSAAATPTPVKTYAAVVKAGKKTSSPAMAATKTPAASEAGRRSEKHFDLSDGRSLPPLTANGNRRWKKPTKAEQKREQAQRNAFEAFASALLHSVSPFMAPLRARCNKALPHLKIDQRFGKSGQPQTAIAQFVAAPLVTNYRPRHFHDVSPGDLEEFMWELGHALEVMPSAYSLIIGYGPVWKRYAVPYLYIACKDYQKEVLSLCPEEIPNSRAEAVYEDDVVKDITDVILAVNELDFLEEMSMLSAMKARAKFQPMFDAFDQIFSPLENYQIEITNLRERPSKFLIKVSQLQVDQRPQPITLYNDPKLWYELPVVSRVVVRTAKGAGSAPPVPTTTDAITTSHGGAAGGKTRRASSGLDSSSSSSSSNSSDSDREGDADHHRAEGHGNRQTAKSEKGHGEAHADRHGSGHGKKGGAATPGVPMWLVAAPLAVSVLCAVATVGIIASKRSK